MSACIYITLALIAALIAVALLYRRCDHDWEPSAQNSDRRVVQLKCSKCPAVIDVPSNELKR